MAVTACLLAAAFACLLSASGAEDAPPPGSGAPPGQADHYFQELDGYLEKFEAHGKAVGEAFKELDALRERYYDTDAPEELLRRRAASLERLRAEYGEIEEIKLGFRRRQNLVNISIFAVSVRTKLEESGMRQTQAMGAKVVLYDAAFGKMKSLTERIERRLDQDEADVKVLLLRLQRRKNLRQLLAGGAALLVAAALVVLGIRYRDRGGREATRVAVTAPAPAAPDAAGFILQRQIGSDERGVVYEAYDNELGRQVAVKRLRGEVLRSRGEVQRILEEVRLVASLKHPNLVEIYSIRTERSGIYLVFEHVDGETLQQVLDRRTKLSPAESLPVIRGIAGALDYAHAQKIIHRDLKPSSVIIGSQGGVKVTDFGLAYRARSEGEKMTRAGTGGTLPYMAPEQEMGGAAKESDIFSFAVCCYEMLTGGLPFPGPNFLAQKSEGLFVPLSQRAPELPAAFDAVIRRGLAPEIRDRFHSAKEFAAALETLI